ncbi:MAG: hypothetical protein AAFO81_12585 [Pseudomonadota bacterium]
MIRPLRQLHRLVWPLIVIAAAFAIAGGMQLAADSHPEHIDKSVVSTVDMFDWQWRSRDEGMMLVAIAADERRASTGVADVYVVDADGENPIYLNALERVRAGVPWPDDRAQQHVRLFDVVRQQWIGAPIALPEH